MQEVYDYALKAVKKVEEHVAKQPFSNGVCAGCKAAGIAARALASCARKQRGSRDDITVMVANMGGNCTCANPPVVLSSATGSSSGLLASSSTGGVTGRSTQQQGGTIATGVQLHSSPAALGQPPGSPSSESGPSAQGPHSEQQPEQQPEQQQPQQSQFKLPKQPQQSLPVARQQQQPQKWRPGSAHGGLLLQPSVCPGPASAKHAAAVVAGPLHHAVGGEGLQHSLLSDLAMSSPFAMMLGTVAEIEVGLVEVSDFSTTSGSAVVSGGSAPPAFNVVAAALMSSGSSGLRKRSLSVALGNSRSCGSVGAPQLGPIASNEPPVVVLS
jgi:hypothetical protein